MLLCHSTAPSFAKYSAKLSLISLAAALCIFELNLVRFLSANESSSCLHSPLSSSPVSTNPEGQYGSELGAERS